MFDIFFNKARELNAQGRPFAMAIVVRREAPVSGRTGDKAIIQADGSVFGWIGGGCTQPVIVQEARQALRDGQPRLVRITPHSSQSIPSGIEEYAMTCHSGGALDIYIEPVMPKPQLVIVGKSVVAQTLARLGKVLHYRVIVAAPGAGEEHFPQVDDLRQEIDFGRLSLSSQTYLVISTQGEHDAEALRQVLEHDFPYVAFVASRKKAQKAFADLGDLPEPGARARLERIKVPAGLDLGARTSEEIAVSILAEIIQVMRSATGVTAPHADQAESATGRQRERLRIGNMTCQHCVQTVERTLKAIQGIVVREVTIGSAEISCDPSQVERRQIAEALERAGYRLQDSESPS